MKRIIDKKSYNTETATKVAGWSNGHTGFYSIEEILYLTKKGNWFLHYFGGAATEYARTSGNSSSEDSGIKVLNSEEALNWLQVKEETEAIEMYFNDEIEEA